MKEDQKKILKYLISGAFALVLLYFSFREVQWKQFMGAMKTCDWGYVLLAMAAGVFSFWLRARRWRMLLLPIDPGTSTLSCLNAVNISYLANMVLPRAGELVRCAYITKNSSRDSSGKKLASYDKALGTMVGARLWDLAMVLLLMGLIIYVLWGRFGSFFSEQLLGKAGQGIRFSTIMLVLVAAVIAFLAAVIALRNRGRLWGKAWNFLKGMGQGLSSSLKMKHGWMFIVYTIGIWLCYWMMCLFIVWAARGIDPASLGEGAGAFIAKIQDLDGVDALFLMTAGAFSSLIPVPGGFGAFHYIVATALQSVYGIPWNIGIIFATLSHESQILTQVICGGISYFWETLRK